MTSIQIVRFPETGMATGSSKIDGARGATLQVGRWILVVPPGAITGAATITITVPDRSKLECDLSISPASANHFRSPVSLIANASGGTAPGPPPLNLFWYDPLTQTWQVVGSSVGASGIVTAHLLHFSHYAGGKGGW